jgi:hypothetical protein
MQYTATTDTFLKKSPKPASALADNEKILVPKGKTYPVKKVLGSDEYKLRCIVVAEMADFKTKVVPFLAELSRQQDFVGLKVSYT